MQRKEKEKKKEIKRKKRNILKILASEKEVENVDKPKQRREIIFHRTLKKKNRAKKGKKLKNDYVNNAELYNTVSEFHFLKEQINYYTDLMNSEKVLEMEHLMDNVFVSFNLKMTTLISTKETSDIFESMNDKMNDIVDSIRLACQEKIDRLETRKIIVEKSIIEDITKICSHLTNSYNFRDYSLAIKQDMIGFALERILRVKPWNGFNVRLSNSVFSFFTRTAFNYYIQYLKKHYRYQNEKQEVLGRMVTEFNSKWCNKGITFNYSEGMDFE